MTASGDGSARAVIALVARVLGDRADQLRTTLHGGDGETFTIAGRAGAVTIEASSPSALTRGIGWYLAHVARAAVNLGNLSPQLPDVLPAPGEPITRTANAPHRYALNDTHDGYTNPMLTWSGWERLLDLLALQGINEALITTGTEAVYEALFARYGYSTTELRAWIPQPAHQPWWLLQNMSGNAAPMPQAQVDARAELGRRVVARCHDLGITPVLPGYFGTVPRDFGDHRPDAHVIPQGMWDGYPRPAWLDPTSDLFAEVASGYYRLSEEILGTTSMYKMDPLHEGGSPHLDVPGAIRAIETALRTARPDATWVLIGWDDNPTRLALSGLAQTQRALIVDGLSDRYTTWRRDTDWGGVPYTFGSIYNFGGHTAMGANTGVWLRRYHRELRRPGTHLSGVAIMPEGLYNNPAAFALLAELPWHDAAPEHADWFTGYGRSRYGTTPGTTADDATTEVWRILAATAYDLPAGRWSQPADSLLCAEPSLIATTAERFAPTEQRYDMARFETALAPLLAAVDGARQQSAIRYDLVDVTQQILSNRARLLLPRLRFAYEKQDVEAFTTLADEWMLLLADQDDVLGTHSDFMLGPLLADAEAFAVSAVEAGRVRREFQQLITVWGTRLSAETRLEDYANRNLHGLVGTYYAPRWHAYLQSLRAALRNRTAPRPIDWYARGAAWSARDHRLPTEPIGDAVDIATRIATRLGLLPADRS